MKNFQIKPCPNCKHNNFTYGFDPVTFLGQFFTKESINDNTSSKNVSKITDNSSAKLVGGFIGQYIRVYRSAKQYFFDKIKRTPLLVCTHCRTLIVLCPHCGKISIIERQPRPDEIIECMYCQGGFQTSEYGNLPYWSLD
ncbi:MULTISPECIES: hypothetical protein [unclassified Dolichospermum]|uniref:hypothetical protein n=1 Tax=unclassified Dolichospermum TaxID=2622029 RepID=UPI0014466CF8|nr:MULTISPECIES: hypothetical protein [unclassified Dolichospermum]MTJ16027.1 hypothetical protein [Dolichospermum sp. UHCC 0299]MTJ39894.1 hypothetical protein [Dolichospermum sp. UHCC 0406]